MSVYLDNNGTTPLKPAVQALMVESLSVFGNPSSQHKVGQKSRVAVDTARRNVAETFGVRSEQVVFTASGTEANVMAIRGIMAEAKSKRIITTKSEHSSVFVTIQGMADEGYDVVYLSLNQDGLIDLAELESELKKAPTTLVSLLWANNETGVILPMEEIVKLSKEYGAYTHVDAVQWAGKEELSFPKLGADAVSISFHKFGGPKGCGALLLKNEIPMVATITGGGQERNRRAGTENVLGIIGAGESVLHIEDGINKKEELKRLQKMLEDGIKKACPSATIVGENAPRVATTTAVIIPNLSGEMAVMSFDMAGICISQGSACSSGKSVPSRVLQSYGFAAEEALCGLRISLAWHSTEADINAFLKTLSNLIERFKL